MGRGEEGRGEGRAERGEERGEEGRVKRADECLLNACAVGRLYIKSTPTIL